MFNFAEQIRTLDEADRLSAAGNHMGALCILLGDKTPKACDHICTSNCRREGCNCECGEYHEEREECDHNIFTCRCGERDWDLEAKDAELEDF